MRGGLGFCLLAAWVLPAPAQLVVRHGVDFGRTAPGSAFETAPRGDGCTLSVGRGAQCGVVDLEFAPGATYTATVTASPLTGPGYSMPWIPTVTCVRESARGEVVSGAAGRHCAAASARERIRFVVGGIVSLPESAAPGGYTATVTLRVSGPGPAEYAVMPASLRIVEPDVSCTLTTRGRVDFGVVSAGREGSVTIDPASGARFYGGRQRDPTGVSGHSAAIATISTTARFVTATVRAPSALRGSGEPVGFVSYMAQRASPTSAFAPALTGSGSSVLAVAGSASFRFGGRVTTTRRSAAGDYEGTVAVSFHCH